MLLIISVDPFTPWEVEFVNSKKKHSVCKFNIRELT